MITSINEFKAYLESFRLQAKEVKPLQDDKATLPEEKEEEEREEISTQFNPVV